MNLRSIDLNLLVIFDALMAEGSITGAARKVGITPSAMSHALHRLRDTFRDELLDRARSREPRRCQRPFQLIAAGVSSVLLPRKPAM